MSRCSVCDGELVRWAILVDGEGALLVWRCNCALTDPAHRDVRWTGHRLPGVTLIREPVALAVTATEHDEDMLLSMRGRA